MLAPDARRSARGVSSEPHIRHDTQISSANSPAPSFPLRDIQQQDPARATPPPAPSRAGRPHPTARQQTDHPDTTYARESFHIQRLACDRIFFVPSACLATHSAPTHMLASTTPSAFARASFFRSVTCLIASRPFLLTRPEHRKALSSLTACARWVALLFLLPRCLSFARRHHPLRVHCSLTCSPLLIVRRTTMLPPPLLFHTSSVLHSHLLFVYIPTLTTRAHSCVRAHENPENAEMERNGTQTRHSVPEVFLAGGPSLLRLPRDRSALLPRCCVMSGAAEGDQEPTMSRGPCDTL